MGNLRNFYFVFIVVAGVSLLAVGYLILQNQGSRNYPAIDDVTPLTSGPETPMPRITFDVSEEKLMVVKWEHLPNGTTHINIYRRKTVEEPWTLWKTIAVAPGTYLQGSATFQVAPNENAGAFSYYAEAVSETQEVLASSNFGVTNSPSPEENGSSLPAAGTPGASTPPSQASGTQTSSPSVQPPATPSFPPLTFSPASPPSGSLEFPSDSASVVYYYTPELRLSSSSTPPVETFVVRHVGQYIEVGWQNLPATTSHAIVSRSKFEAGPWTTLFRQNPAQVEAYSLRLLDNTIYETHYYRLEIFEGNQTTYTYGPVILEPLL